MSLSRAYVIIRMSFWYAMPSISDYFFFFLHHRSFTFWIYGQKGQRKVFFPEADALLPKRKVCCVLWPKNKKITRSFFNGLKQAFVASTFNKNLIVECYSESRFLYCLIMDFLRRKQTYEYLMNQIKEKSIAYYKKKLSLFGGIVLVFIVTNTETIS